MRSNRAMAVTLTVSMMAGILALLPLPALAAPADDLHALRQEVAALRIDRALHLSPDQARALLPVLQGAAADAQARRSATRSALTAALTQARDELRAGGVVSDATRQALAAARKDAWSGMRQRNEALKLQISQVLTPEQLQALRQGHLAMGPAAGHKAHGGGGRLMLARTLTSDAFLALLQARAG